ncbi:MAG TPA: hypothetical protein VK590_00290 [Saprospiraceae bacterium]|nr:hypothetical protein [Saprospiraceae bacterium]
MELISVNECLPELNKDYHNSIRISDKVLAYYLGEYYLSQYVDMGDYQLWEICGDGSRINPTHWVSLPDKPSIKEHGEALYIRQLKESCA